MGACSDWRWEIRAGGYVYAVLSGIPTVLRSARVYAKPNPILGSSHQGTSTQFAQVYSILRKSISRAGFGRTLALCTSHAGFVTGNLVKARLTKSAVENGDFTQVRPGQGIELNRDVSPLDQHIPQLPICRATHSRFKTHTRIVIRGKLLQMDLAAHFQMLARYNSIANQRLLTKCALLDDAEYRKERAGSFGSIHWLLNHILLGDRRWLALFESGERLTPPLNQILYDEFSDLRSARTQEDARIETFFRYLDPAFWTRTFSYTNNQGKDYVETAHLACTHLFNHQTHHRGQVHVMLSQTSVPPPALDLHRIVNP